MGHLSISDRLLGNLNYFYIQLDAEFNIKALKDNSHQISSSATSATGKNLFNYISQNNREEFTSAFTHAAMDPEKAETITAPFAFVNAVVRGTWNICAERNNGVPPGFELFGFISKVSFNESVSRHGTVIEDELAPIFENRSKPFLAFGFDGNIISANSFFLGLLQYEETSLLKSSFLALVDPLKLDEISKYVSDALKGLPQQYGCSLVDRNGKKVRVHILHTPLINNGIFCGVNAFVKKISGKFSGEKLMNKDERRLRVVLSKFKKILDSSLDMICTFDDTGTFTNVSAACKEILGYKSKELIGKKYFDLVHKDDVFKTETATVKIKKGIETTNFENRFYKKDGSVAHLVWSSRWEEADQRFYCIARDATEKKESEAALKASEEKYRILFYDHPIPSWIYDIDTLCFLEVNEAAIQKYGYSREEFVSMSLETILHDKERGRFWTFTTEKDFDAQNHKGMWVHKRKNGELFFAEITSNRIDFQGRKAKLVLSIDRTEQTIAERELKKSNERYYFLSEATFDGIWDWDIKTNEILWNEGAKKMFEITDGAAVQTLEWWYNSLHDDDKERVDAKLKNHLEQRISKWEDEYRFKTANNIFKYIYNRGYIIYDEHNEPARMIGAMQDLTERKLHENMLKELNHSLEKRATELAESNAELERFAYVASHDLQEPLRMVTSFLQLLEKRYKDKLDGKAHEYINYAVDGSERMKKLILDLLEYSRVNSSKVVIEDVHVNEIVADLKVMYKSILQETKGTIHANKLPVVKGNKTQVLQLFQNIIGNACKYKSEAPPLIEIFSEEEQSFYKFGIRDNGIGIDPKFFNKIFIIFQRLHNRDEYSGTGIGLAICKKIIEKHGGKIWLTSYPGRGSTFYFTLPKSNN